MKLKKFTAGVALLVLASSSFAFATGGVVESDSKCDVKVLDGLSEETQYFEKAPINPEFEKNPNMGIYSPLKINYQERFGQGENDRRYFPAKYDLRELNRVTEIRDQGPNGSCWAFATYASMESYLTSRKGFYDFSEKHLRNTHGFDWAPDKGGNRSISAAYLARWSGPVLEKDDPYSPYIFWSPSNLKRAMDIEKVIFVKDAQGPNDNKDIKATIMDEGAIYTTICGDQFFDNEDFNSHYNYYNTDSNHAVAIVGWDDNFSRYNFNVTAPGDGAWIVRNSWGKTYLEDGYYYVSYHDPKVAKLNAMFIPKDKDENGKIYQYDYLGATSSIGSRGKGYMANVYRADSDEKVKEIGLFFNNEATNYKIYAVNNVSSAKDLKDKRVELTSGTIDVPGYYTIDVENFKVKAGEQFAVVVYMDTTSSYYPIPVEMPIGNFSSKATSGYGQSYVSTDGTEWSDLKDVFRDTNNCIKVITTKDTNPDKPVDPVEPKDPVIPGENVRVTGLSVNTKEIEVEVGKTAKIEAKVLPENASNKNIKWTSWSSAVTVDKDGNIKAVREGSTYVVARTEDGNYSQYIWVKAVAPKTPVEPDEPVEPEVPEDNNAAVTGVELEKSSTVLRLYETEKLGYKVLPANAKNKNVKWSTWNSRVAVVDENGVVKAVGRGETYIQIRTVDGYFGKYIKVTVK